MKKGDLILIISVLIVCALFIVFLLNGKKASYAYVYIDGKLIDTLDLSIDTNKEYKTESGINTVEVKDGKIRVKEADCPNKDCMNTGFISKNNETIVCLPHKFSITVKSKKEAEYDIFVE